MSNCKLYLLAMMGIVLSALTAALMGGRVYGTPPFPPALNGPPTATNVGGSAKVVSSAIHTKTVIVQGLVTDYNTRRPIFKFRVTKGFAAGPSSSPAQVVFQKSTARDVVGDGHFVSTFRHFTAGLDMVALRVSAKGYQPETMVLSGVDSPVKLGFFLVRSRKVTVRILNPNGAPAACVNMVQTLFGEQGFVDTRRHPDQTYSPSSRATGVDGKFSFLGPLLIGYEEAVYNSVGYAMWSSRHPPANGVVRLTRWGSVRGQALVAGIPAAGREMEVDVVMSRSSPFAPLAGATVRWYSRTGTDPDGRFLVRRLPVGKATVALLPGGPGTEWQEIPIGLPSSGGSTRALVKIAAGRTAIAAIGVGRLVQGIVRVPAALMVTRRHWMFWLSMVRTKTTVPAALRPPIPQSVSRGSMMQKLQWFKSFAATPAGKAFSAKLDRWRAKHRDPIWEHSFTVKPDGSFSLPAVPPGKYQILIPAVFTDNLHLTRHDPLPMAIARGTFTVPLLRGLRQINVPLKIRPLLLVPTGAVPPALQQQR